MASAGGMMTVGPWSPPAWADFPGAPTRRYNLARTPTPVHRWHLPGTPDGCEVYIKRDDLTGMQLSGNKVRKLEFLLAEAMDRDADCVITIGGVQSNHCRATAVAARYLGLDSHLILRAPQSIAEDGDPGLVGNLLVERAVGANIHLVTKREYAAHGSVALAESLRRRLEREGKRPYVVPVGGSNAIGTWGYVDADGRTRRADQVGPGGIAKTRTRAVHGHRPGVRQRRDRRGGGAGRGVVSRAA